MTPYRADPNRYDRLHPEWFRRCGRSGLLLPAISLGLWHNFGKDGDEEVTRDICFTAFDHGITHFDLANNYGPPPGSAERRFAKIVKHLPREEIIVSTKAGFRMWAGPYGEWGSRKNLLSSLDASLRRMKLDYVDLFYHHRPDPDTPLEESLGALDSAVRQGKALYAGISNYNGSMTDDAVRTVRESNLTRLLIHQVSFSLLRRQPATDLFPVTQKHGMGVICFCPLAQGLLTGKYLGGTVPTDSRAANPTSFLKPDRIDPAVLAKVARLSDIAKARGQSLAQMSLAWVLHDPRVTSALIGASRPEQIIENVAAVTNTSFTQDETTAIDAALAD